MEFARSLTLAFALDGVVELIKILRGQLQRQSRHRYSCPVVYIFAVEELIVRLYIAVGLNFDEVVVKHIDEVLQTQQGVSTAFRC
jgi:hypothetical protein